MSEIKRELVEPLITKKQIISVFVIAALLITAFAFSSYFISLVFGTQREEPSSEHETAEYQNVDPLEFDPPFNFADLLDIWESLSEEEKEAIIDMWDGDPDDLNLAIFAALIALYLLYGEDEVFRVYEYDSFPAMEDRLFRMECFDQYTGQDWNTDEVMEFFDFSSWDGISDMMEISLNLTTTSGLNPITIPTLFSTPKIIEDSVESVNLDQAILYKNALDSASLDLYFTQGGNAPTTYNIFGDNVDSEDVINASSRDESIIISTIRDQFLQLPANYLNNHFSFQKHYNNLTDIINPQDNAFTVTSKIRDYLEENFIFTADFMIDDPIDESDDIVDRFCEKEGGLWSDFASAFALFTRSFNVPSRFVNGYNCFNLTEEYDVDRGLDYASIKLKNTYNWIEVYIPTNALGTGDWYPMPLHPSNAIDIDISLTSNFTGADFRDYDVNLTASLTSLTESVEGKDITFTDFNGQEYYATTDQNGNASIIVNVDESFTVGPHVFQASYFSRTSNTENFMVYGPIQVKISNISPLEVNKSDLILDRVDVNGILWDPISKTNVPYGNVTFVLFEKGTSTKVPSAFTPSSTFADSNGEFSETLIVEDPEVTPGEYEIRADFNGTWYGGFDSFDNVQNSSDRVEFNVTEEFDYIFELYINGQDSTPIIYANDQDQLNLSVTVKDEYGSLVVSKQVNFFDYTNGDILIGSDNTDALGNASILYTVGFDNNKSGPTFIYAEVDNDDDYSYYVLNESIHFDYIYGPSPLEINRDNAFPNLFDIACRLVDSSGDPINYTTIKLEMWNGAIPSTSYIITPTSFQNMDGSNVFYMSNIDVADGTPAGNYTLDLVFDGYFNFSNTPFQEIFNEGELDSSLNAQYDMPQELRVIDPQDISILFKIDGEHAINNVPYDNSNFNAIYSLGNNITFEVWINQSGDYANAGSIVRLYDYYSGIELDSYTFLVSDFGYHEFTINTSDYSMHAGLHNIRVNFYNPQLLDTFNSTYIYLNESIDLSTPISSDYEILRNNGGFTISGYATEGGYNLRGITVVLQIFDENLQDASSDFNAVSFFSTTDNSGFYAFSVSSAALGCPYGKYYFNVTFNGSISQNDLPISIQLSEYSGLILSGGVLIEFNVTAGTIIVEDSAYTKYQATNPNEWVDGDMLYVVGNLTWDNSTGIVGMNITVTVQLLDGTVIAFNTSITENLGFFNVTIAVVPGWPNLRSETKIVVYFDPIYNNLDLVEGTETTYT